jgi:hypothetical protein
MDMTIALADLGVTAGSINDETRERLDRDGYAPLEGVLSGHRLAVMRERLAELLAAEGERAGLEVHQEAGPHGLWPHRLAACFSAALIPGIDHRTRRK